MVDAYGARGSTLEERLRYTNTTIFETFPFPSLPDGRYEPRSVPFTKEARLVASLAEQFDKERSAACSEHQLGLTKIHNMLRDGKLPALQATYEALNDAVDACYGFPVGTWRDNREVLRRLLELNRQLAPDGEVAREADQSSGEAADEGLSED